MDNNEVYNYKTDIDYNILKGDKMDAELFSYIENNFTLTGRAKMPIINIYKFLKIMCKAENIQPSLEQYLYILCNYKRVLNEACAGAGKTTMSKYRMILANLFYNIKGIEILAIAYNKHSALDIAEKYTKSARFLNKNLPNGMRIDTEIVSRTFHQWCKEWVITYKNKFQIQNLKILEESDRMVLMEKRVLKYIEQNKIQNVYVNNQLISSLLALYSYMKETVSEDNEEMWNLCSAKEDIRGLTNKDIKAIFKAYDIYKDITKVQDFSDLVDKMWELVNDPEINARLRRNYKFIMVDEYQDITPSMSRIIEVLMNGNAEKGIPPYYDGYLTCIGDGDQSIYGFRGTDSDNCIKFKNQYTITDMPNEVKITSMSINRRCKSNILNQAKIIIESIQNRISKPVRYLTEGGSVNVKQYSNMANEMLQVIEDIKKIDDLSKACICYRNNASSTYIAMELFDREIPFQVLRGTQPLKDFYCTNLLDILNLINDPSNIDLARKTLYKVLPNIPKCYTKNSLADMFTKYLSALNKNPLMDRKRFFEFDYGQATQVQAFNIAMAYLKRAYTAMRRNAPMSEYMPPIINLLRLNYINGLLKTVLANSLTPEYMNFIDKYFSQNLTYEDFLKLLKDKQEKLDENKNKGIKLTTMHGLKGLEFNDVIVIDLDDTIYPGRELSSKNLTVDQAVKIELESRRLLYVTVTRAKNNLTLYFYQNCPCRYYQFFVDNTNLKEVYDKYENNSFFIQDSATVEKMQKINAIEDEFIFSDEQDLTAVSTPQKQSDDFDIDDLLEDINSNDDNSDLDLTDLFGDDKPEPQKDTEDLTGIVDNQIKKLDVPPTVKSILDILSMK